MSVNWNGLGLANADISPQVEGLAPGHFRALRRARSPWSAVSHAIVYKADVLETKSTVRTTIPVRKVILRDVFGRDEVADCSPIRIPFLESALWTAPKRRSYSRGRRSVSRRRRWIALFQFSRCFRNRSWRQENASRVANILKKGTYCTLVAPSPNWARFGI